MYKPRINLRLSHKLYAQLDDQSKQPGITKTQIVEAALDQYFNGGGGGADETRIHNRLTQLEISAMHAKRDILLGNEMLAQFVLYWLTRTQPLPEQERETARALGQKRFQYFLEQVAGKIAKG